MLPGMLLGAPIEIPLGSPYTQNFDTLPLATNNGNATQNWADDSTIPGWWLYQANNAAASGRFEGGNYVYRVADGTVTPTVGVFHSQGVADATDRTLASPANTGAGELSSIAIFHNGNSKPVDLTRLQYNGESLRGNSGANAVESIFVWHKKSEALATLLAPKTAPVNTTVFPPAVSSGPTSYYISNWNQLGAATYTYTTVAASEQVSNTTGVDVTPAAPIRINPGEYFAVRWSNLNDSGSDALMGIDDVSLSFTEVPVAVVGTVTNVVRHNNGTPRVSGDDTVDFDLVVNGIDTVGTTYTITSPPSLAGTGTYGVVRQYTGISYSLFTGLDHSLDITFQDAGATTSNTASVIPPGATLTPPVLGGFVYNDAGTPDVPADDTVLFEITVDGNFTDSVATVTGTNPNTVFPATYGVPATIGPVPAGITQTFSVKDAGDPSAAISIVVGMPYILGTNTTSGSPANVVSSLRTGATTWVFDPVLKTQRMNNGGGAPAKEISSELVNLSSVAGAVIFNATLEVQDTSSGFEAEDTFTAELIVSDGVTTNTINLVTPYDVGTATPGILVGSELAPTGGTVAVPTVRTYPFSVLLTDSVTSARFVYRGNNNSGAETMIVKDITFGIAPPAINVGLPTNIVRNENGPGLADDTISFDVQITGYNAGATWTSTGTVPSSGPFGLVRLTFPAPLAASPLTSTISATDFPAVTGSLSVAYNSLYLIGQYDFGAGLKDLTSAADLTPSPAWVNNEAARTVKMSTAPAANADGIVQSATLNLTNVGEVAFSANLLVEDTSTGTNFETVDRFKAELVYSVAGVPTTINLISQWDIGDGASAVTGTGANGPPNGYLNGYAGATGTSQVDGTVFANAGADYAANITRDELNKNGQAASAQFVVTFPLAATIPANADSVILKVYGAGVSNSENFTVGSVLFTGTTTAGDGDTDGDGVSDAAELVMGTSPTNAQDVLRLTQNPTTPTQIQFPTVAGKFYRVYVSDDTDGQESTHLQVWKDLNATTINGTGSAANFNITVSPTEKRRFYKLRVQTADSAWPATTP